MHERLGRAALAPSTESPGPAQRWEFHTETAKKPHCQNDLQRVTTPLMKCI